MSETGIGQSVKRREDIRFLTGNGRYVGDINRPGQVYAVFLRSPHAHGRIRGIDASAASQAPGVAAIFTGKDLVADKIGNLTCGWMIHSKDGSPMNMGVHRPLATDRVRHVGDHVAVVLADTVEQARDAAELVAVDYEPLPAVVRIEDAQGTGQPQLHDEAPNNT